MNVSLEIPDIFAYRMHLDGPEAKRRTLIKLAVQSYSAGELTRGQVGALLNLSFGETEALLKEYGCDMDLSVEEFERQSERLSTYIGT